MLLNMRCNLLTILLTAWPKQYVLSTGVRASYSAFSFLAWILDELFEQFYIELSTYFGAVNSFSRFTFYIYIGMKQSQLITVQNSFLFDALHFPSEYSL